MARTKRGYRDGTGPFNGTHQLGVRRIGRRFTDQDMTSGKRLASLADVESEAAGMVKGLGTTTLVVSALIIGFLIWKR